MIDHGDVQRLFRRLQQSAWTKYPWRISIRGPKTKRRDGPFDTGWRTLPWNLIEWSDDGAWRLDCGERKLVIPKRRVIALPAGTPHRLWLPARETLHSTFLCFVSERAPGVEGLTNWTFPLPLSPATSSQLRRIVRSLVEQPDSLSGHLTHQASLMRLLALLTAQGTSPDVTDERQHALQQLDPLLRWIQMHLAEPLTVERLCRQAHLGRNDLFSRFSVALGTSPANYIIACRIRRVQDLLVADRTQTLAALAKQAGLGSAGYLCRIFQSRIGDSPRQWQSRHAH